MRRNTQTVLFTDVRQSTRLRTTLGDDVVDEWLQGHDAVVREVVAAQGGRVVKGIGDGTLATFDSARAAVAAALEMQRRLGTVSGAGAGVHPGVRIGVNTGEVLERDGDVLGEAVNAAARITDAAGAGQILVSRVVRDVVGTTDVEFHSVGTHELRGFPEPWELWEIATPSEATPEGSFRLRLLGEVSAVRGDVRFDALTSARVQRVLGLVVLRSPEWVSRAQLAFTLWPDSTESQARANLRKVLHELRNALPDADRFVEIETQRVRWRPDADASVDLLELQAALDAGDDEAVVESYRGELLPDLYDDWVLDDRDRLRRRAVDAIERAAEDAAARGDPSRAIELADRTLAIDPLREDAYRLLMRAHAQVGSRAKALQAYHRCVEVLARELGVPPDAATSAAYERMRATEAAPAPATSGTAREAAFVGRDAALALAEAAWRSATEGRAQVLLVTGEPGIGKSRLVDELARRIGAAGDTIARSRAYEAAGRLPWAPVIDWLRAEPINRNLKRLPPVWRGELARLLPELREHPADLTDASAALDPMLRRQLLDALVHALAPARPLLLVLDDLQWCDEDSIDLVAHLVHARPSAPLLVALTARPEELDTGDTRSRVARDLARDGLLVEITLDRLDEHEITQIAEAIAGAALDPAEARRLFAESEGNPLFAVELMRAGTGGAAWASLPQTVHAVIGSRLDRLSPAARNVGEAAATIGRGFSTDVLRDAAQLGEDELVGALDELWQRRIVRDHAGGYDFTHDKLREVLLERISPARRRRLHRDVAGALAAANAADLRAVSATLAAHYAAAGMPAEAVAHYRLAADRALEVYALDEVIDALRNALRLVPGLPAGPERDETELAICIALGVPIVVRDGYAADEVTPVYERALALCRRLGRRPEGAVLRGLGLASLVGCDFRRSTELARQVLELEDEDPAARVEGHYLLGVSAFWRGELEVSRHHLETAVAAYRPDPSGAHVARYAQDPKAVCLVRIGLTALWQGDRAAAEELCAAARAHARSLDTPSTLAYVLAFESICMVELDDHAAVRRNVDALQALFDRYGTFAYYMSVGRLLRVWVDVAHGAGEATIEHLAAEIETWRTTNQRLHFSYGLLLLARLHAAHGSVHLGLATVDEALAWAGKHDQHYLDAALLRVRGDLLRRDGSVEGARAAYEEAIAVAESQGATWLREQAAAQLAAL